MNQPSRQRVLRKVGLSSAIAVTALVSGVGVASASTHSVKSVNSVALRSSKDANTTTPPPPPPRETGGVGGDVNALTSSSITIVNFDGTTTTYVINSSTVITKLRHSTPVASLVLGENVHIVPSSTDAGVAGSIDIVPAIIAGRVDAINGDTITVTGPNGRTGTIQVSTATTYSKVGTSASLGDVSVGSFVFGEGTFGSSPTAIEAATVGIGMPGPGPNNGAGPRPMGSGSLPVVPRAGPGLGSNARGVRAEMKKTD
jgi:hypothetical protein